MRRRWIGLLGGAAVAGVLATGAGVAAAGSEEGETPITGPALEAARSAALASTGGGAVTGTEVGDEDARYEVEVTMDDSKVVDVHLDASFVVVGSKADAPEAGDRQ